MDTFTYNGVLGSKKLVRWVPYHLQFLMGRLKTDTHLDVSHRAYAEKIEELCYSLRTAKHQSGDAWEALFVIFLLARCVAGIPHKSSNNNSMVPKHWFEEKVKVTYYARDKDATKTIDDCTSWRDIKEIIDRKSTGKQLAIIYPTHAKFEVYDVIVLYLDGKTIKETWGYQCKERKANSQHSANKEFTKSFVVKGEPPVDNQTKKGWTIPSNSQITEFFGVSGNRWTPQEWRRLQDSLKES
jgi:hypothetical protein